MAKHMLKVNGINREEIAQEVLSSAARVLLLSGFTEEEVGDLFQQVARQIVCGEEVEQAQLDLDVDEDYFEGESGDQSVWGIADKFEQLKPVKALSRLAKRANAINDLDDPAALKKAFALITDAAGLQKEALNWLKGEAEKAGLEIVANHDQWTETATDEQLDEENNVIFLDDYRWSGDFNWYLVGQVARALAEAGDREALTSFSEVFLDGNLAMERQVREDVEKAIGAAGQYEEFLEYVRRHSGAGELAQAEFLDKFVRASGFSSGTYVLESWLEGMAKRGELERYKRSNRWRLLVS